MKGYLFVPCPRILLAILAGIAAQTGAHAQGTDFGACAAIADNQGRLACYDRAAASAAPVTACLLYTSPSPRD